MTEVVAALIQDGKRFLICQRPANKVRGLYWEFVGGKVEPGETPQQALARECKEELDLQIAVSDELMQLTYTYPDITVHLRFYRACIVAGTPRLLEHQDLRWITPDQIDAFQFCPADQAFLSALQTGIPLKKRSTQS